MSDAQIDGGDAGGQFEDGVSDWINVGSNEAAVRWYGLASILMGYLMYPAYWLVFEELTYGALNQGWFLATQKYFFPVGMAWIMVSLFDGSFMRAVFRDVVFISILGPFMFEWNAIFDYFYAGFDNHADNLSFWGFGAFYVLHTTFQAVTQLILLPGVFRWTEQTNYLDNDKSDNSLLALLI